MKNNRTIKLAAILLALVLVTSCFAGGTFAKYVTEGGGEDAARVAKWGVTVEALNDGIFQSTYATEDADAISVIANSVVSTENVVAPGTSGDLAKGNALNISGTPEVAVRVDYALDLELDNWNVPVPVSVGKWVGRGFQAFGSAGPGDAPEPDVDIPAPPAEPGKYDGYWTSVGNYFTKTSDGKSIMWGYYYDWVETAEPVDTYYCPLFFVVGTTPIWTDGYATAEEFEAAVEEAFNASIDVAPGTDLSTIEVPRLYWSWPYESIPSRGNDAYDTMLGDAEVPATISYSITATATQID